MMTRHRTRRHISRPPHTPRAKRSPIRDNPFYHLRSVLLPRILLSLLPRKPCTHPRARRLLATHRHYPPRPLRSSSSKHSRPTCLRSYSYLSPPQHHRRRTKTSNPLTSSNNSTWLLLYFPTRYRVLRGPLHTCRRSLRFHLLRSNRLPRTSRHHRLDLLSYLPTTSSPVPFYIRTPLRV